MVMKGGITSGVVYPRAVCRLATQYRFRRLGGASAGAIAAVMAAAAERGRASGGFGRLNAIPGELGRSLASLLQPSRETAPAFDALSVWAQRRGGTGRKLLRTVGVAVRCAPLVSLAALVLAIAPALAVGVAVASRGRGVGMVLLLWTPVAVAISVILALVVLVRRTLDVLPAHGFGLCDGHTRRGAGGPVPLTDWMTTALDELAGPRDHPGPVTFGDLWGATASEAHRNAVSLDEGEARQPEPQRREQRELRDIDVEVMTTNLTHRRPYRFPFDNQLFHWCTECFAGYFPEAVVAHMRATSTEAADEIDETAATIVKRCPVHPTVQLRHQPRAPDMPLVVAARISLSFPVLISAVPLYAVDWSAPPGQRRIERVWFSDGGIGSNFPMHLFDRAWPRRPTFGIDLQPLHPHFPDQMVWRAAPGASGILPRFRPMSSMSDFLAAIVDTMQNWVDTMQITMPGFRDRVVEVRQRPGEGGMNLEMLPSTITSLADRGAEAAATLDTFDLELHRWIRYRVAMSSLDDLLATMRAAYPGPEGYQELVRSYGSVTNRYPASARPADARATDDLMDVAGAWAEAGHPAAGGRVPRPRPELRQVPRQ
jgi:predicted acylesterase/phospholipase RssA